MASFDVRSAITGATVVCGVAESVATSECARLNAEARVTNPLTGRPMSMECGEVTRYVVVGHGG